MTIEDSLLSAHSYQLLSIATSYLVADNGEFMFPTYFEVFSFIVGWGELMAIEDP